MKVVALQEFRDIEDFRKVYKEGEAYDLSDKRAKELIKAGLVQADSKSGKKSDTDSKEQELIEARKSLEGWASQLSTQESELASKASELASKEETLISKEAELKTKGEELANLKSALESQQSDLESREAALATKEETAKAKK